MAMSLESRVRRLEVARADEIQKIGELLSDLLIDVLERHIPDPKLRVAIREDLVKEIRRHQAEVLGDSHTESGVGEPLLS